MIVGFPGETEADFETLCQFVKAAQFDRLGVFSYSDEETSGSFHLDGKVDARAIYNRKRNLMALQRRISKQRNRKMIGQEIDVLVEGPSPGNRSALAGAPVHASARNRRRLLHQRFRRCLAAARRDPPHANHRSARLRSDRRADRFAR